ncbi:MAG: vanadium-dependent haloperoxidase [Leptolyngbyaceae cyanobacterium MO_188.B28]|nr:vanadium-dependent haloperoxidase [Leptolyngbyaceae cyanobacterium MO_188.B28]
MESRRNQALNVRIEAANLAFNREHPEHLANGEETRYQFDASENTPERRRGKPSLIANYTKGLPHDVEDGLIYSSDDFQQFVQGIDSGDVTDFRNTPLGPPPAGLELTDDGVIQLVGQSAVGSQSDDDDDDDDDDDGGSSESFWESGFTQKIEQDNDRQVSARAWESQAAGLAFDLEGPDAQAVTMPPAPALDSEELIAEVAEVYEMALLRDVAFADFTSNSQFNTAINRLNQLDWFNNAALSGLTSDEESRRRGPLTAQTAFRGITPGDNEGPYLSQFLCRGFPELGGPDSASEVATNGLIQYGALVFQNKVRFATPNKDYMTTWKWWVDVQNGADVRGQETYEGDTIDNRYRFIATPRDLATYVHYDALYEAYLNACLALLSLGAPFDPGIPFQQNDLIDHQQGFAHFGGPHILSLVTEVATRALKAVRFQKFNIHRRLRPEAVGGRIHRLKNFNLSTGASNLEPAKAVCSRLDQIGLLEAIRSHNADQNSMFSDGREQDAEKDTSYLLPMAFPEGSPMHPAYGAGHATVAGACVTILKAFFDHTYVLPQPYVQPATDGRSLVQVNAPVNLTVEGELNKLAANISIGRNWAGVHYFTDYIESIRLGEKIAIGILEEQKLTFGENFTMTVPLFDGGATVI